MNPRCFSTLFLPCFAICLMLVVPTFADELLDVIDAAQTTILKKYPSKDSLARKMALEELEKIARSGQSDEQIIKAVLEKFPETSAELFARSDLNSNSVPDEWEREFKVSPDFISSDSDEDADGFSLLQEYKAGTNPVDPLSHPKYITRIYVSSVNLKRITGLELLSVDGVSAPGVRVVTFGTVRNGRKKTEIVRVGSAFTHNSERFIVDEVDNRYSLSEPVVYIRHVGMSERIPCRLNQPVYLPMPRVRFLNAVDARTSVFPVGATFKLGSKKTGEETYKIVSADPDTKTAVVESVGDKPETFKILPAPNDVPAVKNAAKPAPAKTAASAKAPANNAVKPPVKEPVKVSVYARSAEVNFFSRQPASVRNVAPGTVPANPAARPSVPAASASSSKNPVKSAPSAASQPGAQAPARFSQRLPQKKSAKK